MRQFFHKFYCVIIIIIFLLYFVNNGETLENPCNYVIDTTLVRDFSACDKYFVCSNGTGIATTCKTGLYFEPTFQICLPASQVECNLCLPGDFTLLPHHGSCAKYFFCYDGTVTVRECASELLFDKVNQRCDFPENVICEGPVCPLVNDPLDIIMFPSPFACSDFYVCFNGSLLRRQCAAGLHWNDAIDKCDYPENAECKLDQLEPEITEIECEPGVIDFVPHPTSCYHYFICVNGNSIMLRCAENLVFDYTTKQCNFRESSICFSEL